MKTIHEHLEEEHRRADYEAFQSSMVFGSVLLLAVPVIFLSVAAVVMWLVDFLCDH